LAVRRCATGGIALGQVSGPWSEPHASAHCPLGGVTYLAGPALRRPRRHPGSDAPDSKRPCARSRADRVLGSLAIAVALAVWALSLLMVDLRYATLASPSCRVGGAGTVRSAGAASVVYAAALRNDHEGSPTGRSSALARGRCGARPAAQRLAGSRSLSEIAQSLHTTLVAGITEPVGRPSFETRSSPTPHRCPGSRVREGSPGSFRRVRPVAVALLSPGKPRGNSPGRISGHGSGNDGDTSGTCRRARVLRDVLP